jgi:hypothetical protein
VLGSVVVVLAVCVLCAQPAAARPNPEKLADKCISVIDRLADGYERCNEKRVTCAEKIVQKLVDKGKPEKADRLIDIMIRATNRSADASVWVVGRLAGRCIDKLERMGVDPPIIESVEDAADAAETQIRDSQDATVTALEGLRPVAP